MQWFGRTSVVQLQLRSWWTSKIICGLGTCPVNGLVSWSSLWGTACDWVFSRFHAWLVICTEWEWRLWRLDYAPLGLRITFLLPEEPVCKTWLSRSSSRSAHRRPRCVAASWAARRRAGPLWWTSPSPEWGPHSSTPFYALSTPLSSFIHHSLSLSL